jgi:DNA-binding beta-propeller fold protein YncE
MEKTRRSFTRFSTKFSAKEIHELACDHDDYWQAASKVKKIHQTFRRYPLALFGSCSQQNLTLCTMAAVHLRLLYNRASLLNTPLHPFRFLPMTTTRISPPLSLVFRALISFSRFASDDHASCKTLLNSTSMHPSQFQKSFFARWKIGLAWTLFVGHLAHITLAQDGASLAYESPLNQALSPVGYQIDLPGSRPQVIAMSPDGLQILTSGQTNQLVVIDPETQSIVDSVPFPSGDHTEPPEVPSQNILQPDKTALASYTGLVCSSNGKRTYVSNVMGSIKVFDRLVDGKLKPSFTIPLPKANAPRRAQEIPSGLALSSDDSKLYVCGNLSNTLLEIDSQSLQVLRTFAVGVAPYDVTLVNGKAYVSNWGGRRPTPQDVTGPAGRGTTVRVDPVRFIANEGSVSIIDLANGMTQEILVGLSPCDLQASPDQRFVVCANSNSDTLSIIDTRSDEVVETVWVKARQSDLYGAAPNALAFHPSGKELYVANGSQNAIGVVEFDPQDKGETKLKGLIPVGWYPGAVAFDSKRNRICVANLKGLPRKPTKQGEGFGFNSRQHFGSVSVVPLPTDEQLMVLSEQVAKNNRREALRTAALPARPDQPPRAVPERVGEPSLIEHVVYIIKENRTYDQVLGDIERGNGNRDLCIFGRDITPNHHRLAEQFVLLDNTYCCGILSADGHQWSTSAMSTAYLEKSFASFPRSYPDGMGEDESDALAYSPAGFLWDNAILHKKTLRNYGEFMKPKVRWTDPAKKGAPDYMACFRTWKGGDEVIFASEPAIESIRPYSPTGYVGWSMTVPDQVRADFILRELKEFELQGSYPNLTLICLPNDHTNGTAAGTPTPAAYMADSDLAFARIVEGLSKSKFWPKMAVFSIEDDPQNGWDHVSGYRTTAYCISPYAKRNTTVSTRYNTTSIVRTMEQILGLPPMNQFDASATPMFDCFTDTPNLTPYEKVPVSIALDSLNPKPEKISDANRRRFAESSASINFEQVDKAPEELLNRILWNAMKGDSPFPDWAITVHGDEDDEDDDDDGNERERGNR